MLNSRYPNSTRKMLAILGIVSAILSFTPYFFENGGYLRLISPSVQAIVGYCYMIAIKGMCKQYWQLLTQGLTMKEMASRSEAARTYRI